DAPIDTAAVPVKVTVLGYAGDGALDTGVTVVFQDAAGNRVFDGPVDAMGKVEAVLPQGGTVTSIHITSDTPTQLTANASVRRRGRTCDVDVCFIKPAC